MREQVGAPEINRRTKNKQKGGQIILTIEDLVLNFNANTETQ